MGLSTGILGAPASWSPVPATDLKPGRAEKGSWSQGGPFPSKLIQQIHSEISDL